MKTPFTLIVLMLVLLTTAMPALAESVGSFADHTDVGGPAKAGAAAYDETKRTYTVTGGGANMWLAKDSFHFVWKKVTGDVVLTADIAFEGKGAEPHRKACLLVRQSLDADSIYADAALHGDGTAALQHRDAKGGATSEVKAGIKAPSRLRLEKTGRIISLLVPGAGGEFVPAGKIELDLTGPFYVGLGVCAHNDAQLETAVFSNVELKQPAAPAEKPAPGPPKAKEAVPGPNAVFAELEKKVLYHPRPYAAAAMQKFTAKGGRRLDYTTAQGAQCAWLIPSTSTAAPEKLWIVCGGNGTLALEMEGLCRSPDALRDAWLLVDYPGYGECKGEPSPATIRENLKASVLLAAKQLSIEPAALPQRCCTLGHSLGCAAALLAVEEFHLHSAVLCAPFTSTADMAHEKFMLPLDFPLAHVFDNRAGLREIAANKGHAWIFHGLADEVIPVAMSETLAKEFKDAVNLKTIPGGSHNDIFRRARAELTTAMNEARK